MLRQSKKATPRKDNDAARFNYGPLLLSVLLVILGLAISIFFALEVSGENNRSLETYFTELLSLYSEGIGNDIINAIDDLEISATTLMTLSPDLTDDVIENRLRTMIGETRGYLSNVLFIRPVGGGWDILYPYYPISRWELEPLIKEVSAKESGNSSIIQSTRIYLLSPYTEPMGGSTILPYLIADSERDLFMVYYINITNLLQVKTSLQENSILSSSIAFDINIYNQDGTLLETSANRTHKTSDTLIEDDIYSHFSLYSEALQLYFYKTEDSVWMMKMDSTTGLSVAIKAPYDIINSYARSSRQSIMVVALLCLLSILVILFVGVWTIRQYQMMNKLQEEARFEALSSKMNPHLLFNTLDSIAYSVEDDKKEDALSSIKSLAYILQSNLRDTSTEATIVQQIKYLYSYIRLQQIRYQDKFTFDLDDDLGDYSIEDLMVIRHSVQPIVENCFKHSIHEGMEDVSIRVLYEISDSFLIVTVSNSGCTMTEEEVAALHHRVTTTRPSDTSHIGLMSIHYRIRLRYGQDYGLEIPYTPGFFTVRVRLPIIEA